MFSVRVLKKNRRFWRLLLLRSTRFLANRLVLEANPRLLRGQGGGGCWSQPISCLQGSGWDLRPCCAAVLVQGACLEEGGKGVEPEASIIPHERVLGPMGGPRSEGGNLICSPRRAIDFAGR